MYFLNYFSLFSFIRASIFFSYGSFFNSCTVKVIFSPQVFISLIIIMLFLCSLIIIPSMSHQHHIIIHIPSSHIFSLSPLGFFGNHHFFSFLLSSLLLFSYSLPLYVKRISLFYSFPYSLKHPSLVRLPAVAFGKKSIKLMYSLHHSGTRP